MVYLGVNQQLIFFTGSYAAAQDDSISSDQHLPTNVEVWKTFLCQPNDDLFISYWHSQKYLDTHSTYITRPFQPKLGHFMYKRKRIASEKTHF